MRSIKNSNTLVLLGIEHQRFGQVLDVLERQVERIESGGGDRQLIELVVDYFLDFPDACHHPKEDLLFAQVMANSPVDREEFGDLVDEHRELSELTRRIRQLLDTGPEDGDMPESTVAGLKDFLRSYRHHIEAENREFFPLVLRYLSQQDLDLIDFNMFDRQDPLYDSETEGRFAQLRTEIMARGTSGDGHHAG